MRATDFSGLIPQLHQLKEAARRLRSLSSEAKNQVLLEAARLLDARAGEIIDANRNDLNSCGGATPAFIDRLTLNADRLARMGESLRQVARLSDPVGEVVEARTLPNGLKVSRQRSPLGVILIIFESRPNVALEAFSLAFKAGNAVILRGGKESKYSTAVLYQLLGDALRSVGAGADCLWGIIDPDRKKLEFLLEQERWIDVVVPRGGEKLIEFVTRHSRIPLIKNDRGLCHVYVHEDADLAMAEKIIINAKAQRPGVCNAMETLLVHEAVAPRLLPSLRAALAPHDLKWHACERSERILTTRGQGEGTHQSAASAPGRDSGRIRRATASDWDHEYLAYEMNCRMVNSLEEALAHIERHGSRHSEAILTSSEALARRFQLEVDAAAVYWNASTRFTDGFELGLGGEVGISTQKLHVRGPVGLRELTGVRWVIDGTGQIRV